MAKSVGSAPTRTHTRFWVRNVTLSTRQVRKSIRYLRAGRRPAAATDAILAACLRRGDGRCCLRSRLPEHLRDDLFEAGITDVEVVDPVRVEHGSGLPRVPCAGHGQGRRQPAV